MDCSRVPLGGSRLKFALTCKQFAAIGADNNLRLPGCTVFPFIGSAQSRLFPCVFKIDHDNLETGVLYVAGEIDRLDHASCYDYMQYLL
jgi:hypothetical protein